jgi:hypothetical protein
MVIILRSFGNYEPDRVPINSEGGQAIFLKVCKWLIRKFLGSSRKRKSENVYRCASLLIQNRILLMINLQIAKSQISYF